MLSLAGPVSLTCKAEKPCATVVSPGSGGRVSHGRGPSMYARCHSNNSLADSSTVVQEHDGPCGGASVKIVPQHRTLPLANGSAMRNTFCELKIRRMQVPGNTLLVLAIVHKFEMPPWAIGIALHGRLRLCLQSAQKLWQV